MIDNVLKTYEDQKNYFYSLHYNLSHIVGELEHLHRASFASKGENLVLSQKEVKAIKTAKNQLLKIWRT